MSPRTLRAAVAPALMLSCTTGALGGLTNVILEAPTFDRWNYGFNPTPGTRAAASTFAAIGEPSFDNRDGQMLLTYDTASGVTPGLGAGSYDVVSARIVVQNSTDLAFVYDDTQDSYTAFLDEGDPEYVADADAGQPLELYGSGFRDGFDALLYGETGPYSLVGPIGQGIRTAYPIAFDANGDPVDVSLSVDERFDPKPWAIGTIDTVAPGDYVPLEQTITFEIDVNDPDIQAYLGAGLDAGLVSFMSTSLTRVVQMGGEFPSFYLKESPVVIDGFAHAARLELDVVVGAPCTGDVDASGAVDFGDLLSVLSNWGACAGCDADVDGSGAVDFGDLLLVLSNWGPCA